MLENVATNVPIYTGSIYMHNDKPGEAAYVLAHSKTKQTRFSLIFQ